MNTSVYKDTASTSYLSLPCLQLAPSNSLDPPQIVTMTRTGFLAAAKYPWRPVPLLIQSPEWVKRAVGIFLKSIAGFREVAHEKGWKIPSVDMIDLENDRMLRVRYGDTATLCTHLVRVAVLYSTIKLSSLC